MHGVGLPFAKAAFEAFGFPASSLAIVAEQANPDPAFPTLRFPNPEEKGSFTLAVVVSCILTPSLLNRGAGMELILSWGIKLH